MPEWLALFPYKKFYINSPLSNDEINRKFEDIIAYNQTRVFPFPRRFLIARYKKNYFITSWQVASKISFIVEGVTEPETGLISIAIRYRKFGYIWMFIIFCLWNGIFFSIFVIQQNQSLREAWYPLLIMALIPYVVELCRFNYGLFIVRKDLRKVLS